jgi:hypothetical protein
VLSEVVVLRGVVVLSGIVALPGIVVLRGFQAARVQRVVVVGRGSRFPTDYREVL